MRDLEIHCKTLNKLSRELRPIAAFLDDPGVTDILLNPDGRIWLDTIDRGKFPTDTWCASNSSRRLPLYIVAPFLFLLTAFAFFGEGVRYFFQPLLFDGLSVRRRDGRNEVARKPYGGRQPKLPYQKARPYTFNQTDKRPQITSFWLYFHLKLNFRRVHSQGTKMKTVLGTQLAGGILKSR